MPNPTIDKFQIGNTTYDFIDSTARNTADAAVPQTRKVNNKALSADVTLTSDDIGYDSTETYSSGTIGNELTQLSTALIFNCNNEKIELIDGYYITTNQATGNTVNINSPVKNANYAYAVVDCQPDDIFTYNGAGGSSPRSWAFIDSNNLMLKNDPAGIIYSEALIQAPANSAKLVINFNKSISGYYALKGMPLKYAVKEIGNDVDAFEYPITNLTQSGYYIGLNGKINSTTYSSVKVTPFIEIPSDAYGVVIRGGNIVKINANAVAFYSSNDEDTYIDGAKWDGNDIYMPVPEGAKYVVFSTNTTTSGLDFYVAKRSILCQPKTLSERDESENVSDTFSDSFTNALSFFRNKKCFDHLFVQGSNYTFPQQSVFHVRISKMLGFDVFEINVCTTSDGVYFAGHAGSTGNFGRWFEAADGVTDISDIVINTKTWEWVEENVRYKSSFPQFRTRPNLVEEVLHECSAHSLIPLIYAASDEVIELAKEICGENNFIGQLATRQQMPNGMISIWDNSNTKNAILQKCEQYGKPLMYGMADPSSFTDEELQDIINTLHENGYLIGTAYADTIMPKLSYMGFDYFASMMTMNRIKNGNICNIYSFNNFDGFTVTNATESNGVLTFDSDGTFSPIVGDNTVYPICGIDLEIVFDGTIVFPAKGLLGQSTFTSDGTYPVFISVPIINGDTNIQLSVSSGTEIYSATYKASKL